MYTKSASLILNIQYVINSQIKLFYPYETNVRAPSNAFIVALSKKLYLYCLVLFGSRNRFERDFTIKLK